MYEHTHIRENTDIPKWPIIRIFKPNFPKNVRLILLLLIDTLLSNELGENLSC